MGSLEKAKGMNMHEYMVFMDMEENMEVIVYTTLKTNP